MFHLTSHLMRLKLAVAITFLTLFSLAARAQFEGQEVQEQATRPGERQLPKDPTMFGPVVWSMVATPIHPVRGTDWRIHLIYELHVTNASQEEDTVRINSIEVLDARNDRVTGDSHVISPDGQDVTGKVLPFWKFNSKGDAVDFTDRLGPGQGGIVYFDVTYDAPKDVPRRLKHRFVVSSDKHPKITTVVDGGAKVSRQEALVVAPPLRGDNWVNIDGSGAIISGHRQTVMPTNGTLRSLEHFAIDFIRVNAQGHAFVGDKAILTNWVYFQSEILSAVARQSRDRGYRQREICALPPFG